ncbi:hypothetical protein [Kordiimonas sp.]|uniref:hypothetical protein n=1 Tax=Kordiimonas sp. TaxID=1970157 RepID=UPI003A932056
MADKDQYVNPAVIDAVIQANISALGNSSALSVAQTSLALAQSQSVLFAHMVNGYGFGGAATLASQHQERHEDREDRVAATNAEQTQAIKDLKDLLKDYILTNKNDLACY